MTAPAAGSGALALALAERLEEVAANATDEDHFSANDMIAAARYLRAAVLAEDALETVTQAIDDELHNSPVAVGHTRDGTPYVTEKEWRRGVELGERMSVARRALAALRAASGSVGGSNG